MPITNRNNHLVVGKRAILIRDITESVCNRKSMDWIKNRYPIDEMEVWECIDTIADIDDLPAGVHLKVRNTSADKQDIVMEVAQISDTFFIKTIQYGKIFLPDSDDFELIFNVGLNRLALESYDDIVNGSISYQGYANVIADPGTNIGIDTLVNLDESIFDWTHYGQNY